MKKDAYEFIIIGGGLSGLCAAIHLSKIGYDVLLLEKNQYPRHKVCGEYVSNEVLPYLKFLGFDPFEAGAVRISDFEISTSDGRSVHAKLPLGGFGISRHCFDQQLYEIARKTADIHIATAVEINRLEDGYQVVTKNGDSYESKFVVGAFGKRSRIDHSLKRRFVENRTQWMAVKYHLSGDFPLNKVALHNFDGGYCGLSKTESGSINMCYLASLYSFGQYSSIEEFEENVLRKNPNLSQVLDRTQSLFTKPLTISQISFQKKAAVEDGIFMLGDSAGLIHPLCGNGMAMAIHSAKLLGDILEDQTLYNNREFVELTYNRRWKSAFSSRMRSGAIIQRILLNNTAANMAFRIGYSFPSIIPGIIRKTHGKLIA